MAKTFHRLSSATVRSAGLGMHPDGLGLYLQCTLGSGGRINKSWFFRFARDGQERRMGLGSLQDVSLARARELANAARRLHRDGIDPIAARNAERKEHRTPEALVSFRDAFTTFFAAKRQTLANCKHAQQWQRTMETYVFPTIGDRPVADVTTREVLEVLTPIWFNKPETARRVLQRIEAVFKSAILRGHRDKASPCIGVAQELGTRHRKVVNHRALPYKQIPHFVASLRSGSRSPVTQLAFEWLILTATRSGETRLARWNEIDEELALWTIPTDRMKAKRPHIVPLAPRCLEILIQIRDVLSGGDLVFPGTKAGEPLSDMTLTKVLRDMGLARTMQRFTACVAPLRYGAPRLPKCATK